MSKPNSVVENWEWGALPLLTQVGWLLYLHNGGKKNTPQHCVVMKTSGGVYDKDIYRMLAETKRLPPDIHISCWTSDRWRRLRGKPETCLKLDVSTELTNVYKQVYCTLKYACRQKGSGLRGLDEMVWKTHAFSGKARSAHQPHPKQTKTKIFFSHSIHKKRNTL